MIEQNNDNVLRFMTCGSVDDGKSTLIGRLLFDSKTILTDTLSQIEKTSKMCSPTPPPQAKPNSPIGSLFIIIL
jgi:translation elongation factor EF-1alpha